MKVLFICSGNNPFGISPLIKSQGNSLIKAGVDLKYFSIPGKGFYGYAKAVASLKNWLKINQVDLLHAHYGLCGWVSYLAKPKKIPMILSYMGSDVLPQTLIAGINKKLKNRVAHVIVKSNNIKDVLQKKNNISVIPNGVDLEHFFPQPKETLRERLKLSKNRKIILFLGNPRDKNKNFQLVEKAVKIIKSPNILLLAPYPLEPTQVSHYLNAADVLVFSSISEGSPNVIKEAMACNCPIVATDVGDAGWVMGDTAGCFLTSFTVDDMARKIEMAINFTHRTNGRERIIKLGLDRDTIAERIVTIYKFFLESSNGK